MKLCREFNKFFLEIIKKNNIIVNGYIISYVLAQRIEMFTILSLIIRITFNLIIFV